jgi:sn-glycerol 3-phosphate transport system ATP-binding protein
VAATLVLRGLRKSFGAVGVLHGVDIEVAAGELLVIVGASGCGKSTLLRLVAGLEEPSGGAIELDGRDVARLDPADRDIAMVFQNYALYPHMTVYDNMAYGLRNAKVPKDEIERRVQKAAGILELGGLLERKPRQLSGGQRQRVAMGRAIVRQPQVFLFDEPLSNLDAKLRAQTRLEIQKLHRELGITSLFVTHDQVEAMTLAQRMIVMNAGRIEQIGTPEQVYGVPATTFVASFIGSPPMNLLNGQATPAGFEIGGQLLPLPGAAPRQGSLTLGLRPEHTEPGAEGDPACWPLHVEVVEMLGAERLVHGHLAGAAFTLRIDGTLTPPRHGQTLHLRVPAERLHWFDPSTGQRVEAA